MTEGLPEVGDEEIEVDVFDRDPKGLVGILTASALGLADPDPVGRPLRICSKAVGLKKGFY